MARSLLTAMDKSIGIERAISLGTVAQVIVEANEDRLAIVFGGCASGPYFLSTEPSVALQLGMVLAQNGLPIVLSRELHGGLVKKAWYAVASVARTFSVFEVLPGGADEPARQ